MDHQGGLGHADAHTARAFDAYLEPARRGDGPSKESPKVRERYGDGKPYKFQYDGAADRQRTALMAPAGSWKPSRW